MGDNCLTDAIEEVNGKLEGQGREKQNSVEIHDDGFSISFRDGRLIYRTSFLKQDLEGYLTSQEEKHKSFLGIVKKAEFRARDTLRRYQPNRLTNLYFWVLKEETISSLVEDGETRVAYDQLFLECADAATLFFRDIIDEKMFGKDHTGILVKYISSREVMRARTELINLTAEISSLWASSLTANETRVSELKRKLGLKQGSDHQITTGYF
jgi:hypothetical protein